VHDRNSCDRPGQFLAVSQESKDCGLFQGDRADKLGSGVRNIFKYTPIYEKGAKPKFIA